MILAIVLAVAAPAATVETAEDRLFRLGEENHVLAMRLHDRFFQDAEHQKQLREDFAPACAAHFLAFRTVEPRYEASFRPIVVESMKALVPADRLAAARRPLNHDPQLVAWTGRVRDKIRQRGAAVIGQATADYDREIVRELPRAARLDLPPAEKADRSSMNGPNLAIACASYFGNNREAIMAAASKGVSH